MRASFFKPMTVNDEHNPNNPSPAIPAPHHTAAQRPLPGKPTKKPAAKIQRKAAIIHWLNKHGLSRRKLRGNKVFGYFGDHLFTKDLWTFKPDSMSKGWLIGSLSACTPLMGAQIIIALPFALLFRANIPIIVGLILLTNPATAVPFYGFAFWFGCMIMGSPLKGEGEALKLTDMGLSTLVSTMNEKGVFHFLGDILSGVFLTLMVGCMSIGITVGLLGFFVIRFFVKQPPPIILRK